MFFVYQIRSVPNPRQRYTGLTDDLKGHLESHNAGQSESTANNKPWKIVFYFAFTSFERAKAFERYLNSGAGRAFANKRFK